MVADCGSGRAPAGRVGDGKTLFQQRGDGGKAVFVGESAWLPSPS